jgi:hypothetical protein
MDILAQAAKIVYDVSETYNTRETAQAPSHNSYTAIELQAGPAGTEIFQALAHGHYFALGYRGNTIDMRFVNDQHLELLAWILSQPFAKARLIVTLDEHGATVHGVKKISS